MSPMSPPVPAAAPLVVGFDLDMTLIDTAPGLRARCCAVLGAELGVEFPVAGDDRPARAAAGPGPGALPARPRPSVRPATASARSTPTTRSPRSRRCRGPTRPWPPYAGTRGRIARGDRQVTPQRPAAPRPPRTWTSTCSKDGSGASARPTSCAARAPRSTSATTSTTSRGPWPPGATSVSVLTGGCTREELLAAGTHVVLDDLTAFPAWLDEHLLSTRLAALRGRPGERVARCWWPTAGAPTARCCWPPPCAPSARTGSWPPPATPTPCPRSSATPPGTSRAPWGSRCSPRRPTRWSARGTAPTPGDRCFFCKAELIDVLRPLAPARGLAHVATGTNADDAVAGFRPGIRAAAERGAVTPLRDAGLTKAQVREALAPLGPADLGQAGGGVPVLAGRLRRRGHPAPAGPGGAGRGGRARPAGRRWACGRPAGARPRVSGPRSRSTPPCCPLTRGRPGGRCWPPCGDAGFPEVVDRPAGLPLGLAERARSTPERDPARGPASCTRIWDAVPGRAAAARRRGWCSLTGAVGPAARAGPGDLAAGAAGRSPSSTRPVTPWSPCSSGGACRGCGCTPTPPGVTLSRGRPRGPGMVAMLAAGYLAPARARSAAPPAAGRRGHSAGAAVAAGRCCSVCCCCGSATATACWCSSSAGAGLALVSWYAAPTTLHRAGLPGRVDCCCWPLRARCWSCWGRAARGRRGSDPDQLARLTRVPGVALGACCCWRPAWPGSCVGVATLRPRPGLIWLAAPGRRAGIGSELVRARGPRPRGHQ